MCTAGVLLVIIGCASFGRFFATASAGAVVPSDAEVIIEGEASSNRLAASLSSGGDVNGDGYDDIVLGASQTTNGTAYLILGGCDGTTCGSVTGVYSRLTAGVFDADDADVEINGESKNDYAGSVVALSGDVDNDGFDDIIIGAFRRDITYTDSGSVYVLRGGCGGSSCTSTSGLFKQQVSGALGLAQAGAEIVGPTSNAKMATSIAVGDFDADSYDDVFLGTDGGF